jgi:hypothetical protein
LGHLREWEGKMVHNDRLQRQGDEADQTPGSGERIPRRALGAAKARGDPDHQEVRNAGRDRPPAYETWTRERLYAHARNLGIKRRSSMNKQQLIDALREGSR